FSSTPRRGPGLFPGTHFPSMGKQKGLVVLVEYTDTKFNTAYDPADYFARMLNEPGFSDYSATGSAVDFFRESSMGQFEPEFDVYGPITLSRNMAYYGGNDWYGNDSNPQKMVIEACQQLDATVDFSQYDRDGDGYIDNVFVFYAGRGEASGGSADTVWPHSWDVSAAESVTYTFDGVILDHYACSNEWEGSRPDGVGTFVHEFSHVMGLPDLYATSYTSAFTPGAWSAMDYGPYNNNGCTPPLYSAYERYSLGWIEPLPIGGPINATLYPIGTNQAGIIATGDPEEYFLVENRQQTGWDTYIPGHGMLVWHVDYDSYVWSRNVVNNTASHQYVDIEEADGIQSESTRAGDAFPGTSGKTSFTATTSPAMKTWAGKGLDFPITEIA
ncbi:MAG: M6 family metalloprotease domain-containing protein, partial [Muribaculaceae bacterium]|nr:M6 family metalloprotease domain-containing protein [Muribaculaceae bacterium]